MPLKWTKCLSGNLTDWHSDLTRFSYNLFDVPAERLESAAVHVPSGTVGEISLELQFQKVRATVYLTQIHFSGVLFRWAPRQHCCGFSDNIVSIFS